MLFVRSAALAFDYAHELNRKFIQDMSPTLVVNDRFYENFLTWVIEEAVSRTAD